MMEVEKENSGKNGVNGNHWWWALASMVQLGWAISAFQRGYRGSSNLMPVKAFGVATLFVGSGAAASVASLQSSGIHKVEDLLEVGANIRTRLGIRPRAQEEKTDDL